MFDLILCGKRASDSDTALVTTELAEMLALPHIPNVINCDVDAVEVAVKRETDDGYDMLKMSCPAVLSVGKTINGACRLAYKRVPDRARHESRAAGVFPPGRASDGVRKRELSHLLLDMVMPMVSGLELGRKIRRKAPTRRSSTSPPNRASR